MSPVSETPGTSFDVVIVGGGAAGTLVAIRLLMREGPALRVAIVEPDAVLARGAAYGTDRPEHLLNVVAGRMSALPEQPDHFVRFLAGEQPGSDAAALAERFAPRRDYGRYLRHTLEALPARAALAHLRDRVVAVERAQDYRLQLASGAQLQARHVVIAMGNTPRPLPSYLRHDGMQVAEAWDYDAVAAIPADAEVCILGSGLSMVDAALSFAHAGHRGPVHVVSRHGLMPLSHAAPGPHDGDGIDALLAMGLRARWRELRRRVAEATAAGEPWQWTFDRLRPHGQALWKSMGALERRRFLRHAVRYWDIHRHRIAPEVAQVLERLQASGQLDVVSGRLRAVVADAAGGSRVHFRPRHAREERSLHADWIVNATGVETNIDLRPGELLLSLREQGLVAPGPQGLGIASRDDGHVLDLRGRPVPGLYVIGALRIGELWESIAIPELRGQARAIAEAISAGETPAA